MIIKLNRRVIKNFCKCGCGTEINPTKTWSKGHQFKGQGKPKELHLCECNCGEMVEGRFKHGHNARVDHWSKGPDAEKICDRLSVSASLRTGEKSPRYGKTKETNPAFSNGGCPKGTIPHNKGKGEFLTPEARARVTAASTGHLSWNKGKHGYFSEEALKNMSRQDKPHKPESIEKMRVSAKIANENLSEESRQRRIDGGKKPKPESMKKKISALMKGPNNPFYIDGRCSGENYAYPEGWNESLKEQIRDRDGRKCRICCKSEEDNGKQLDVHHVDYDKKNLQWLNLISLCKHCHRLTNPKPRRDAYQKSLSNLLLQDIPLELRFIGRQEDLRIAA